VTLTLAVQAEAAAEVRDAIAWFDKGAQGRGQVFRSAFNDVVDRCLLWPESAPVYGIDAGEVIVRSAGVPGFGYAIVYLVEGDVLYVVALAHERRRPGYWQARLSPDSRER
jgi:hypothetical protein